MRCWPTAAEVDILWGTAEYGDQLMNTQPPIHARAAESAGTDASLRPAASSPAGEPRLPPDGDPDAAVEKIIALLRDDRYLPARRLATEAVARFPEHAGVKKVWRVFDNRGKATIGSGGPEPSADEEFEWLRHPPEWARGKWVALVGSEAVAVGPTLAEVTAAVRSQNLPKRPLVHRID